MAEHFNEKDYGEYFAQLERQLEQQAHQAENPEPPPTVSSTEAPAPVRKKRRRSNRRRRLLLYKAAAAVLAVCLIGGAIHLTSDFFARAKSDQTDKTVSGITAQTEDNGKKYGYAKTTAATAALGDTVQSKYAIVINLSDHTVVAQKGIDERTPPASTTKVMTVLVAADLITDYNDTFVMTQDITDPLYVVEATVAGFAIGESITMTDLFYGTILPSGADAAIGLAIKLAGSEEAFVALMNRKATELGLKNTHFDNVSGLYDSSHYSSVADMAVITEAAMDNEFCRKVLSTYQYTTAATPQHPDGIPLSATLFNYMYGTEPEGADIIGGKTGFVNESGYCITSFGHSDGGTEYLCVTFSGPGRWPAFQDQIALYSTYAK